MCFLRKPGLGHYHGTRADWRNAYRAARIAQRNGKDPDPATSGLTWKAGLIVAYERADYADPLTHPVVARMESKRIIDEILRA